MILSKRERYIAIITVGVALIFGLDRYLVGPLLERKAKAAADIADFTEKKLDPASDAALHAVMRKIAAAIEQSLRAGGKLLVAGNGGSAADAQHIAGEFLSRLNFDRHALPAVALTTDTSVLTAIGNDYGFEHVFERQVRGLGRQGDVFLALSTSGRSPNILAALRAARELKIATVGFTGARDSAMRPLCDLCLCAPSEETPLIQQIHIVAAHAICGLVERALCGGTLSEFQRSVMTVALNGGASTSSVKQYRVRVNQRRVGERVHMTLIRDSHFRGIERSLSVGAPVKLRIHAHATPALFLDRDGVINVDHGYVHRIEDFEFIPGIFDLVRCATGDLRWPVVVVSNQSGIGRGKFDEAAYQALTRWMCERFAAEERR